MSNVSQLPSTPATWKHLVSLLTIGFVFLITQQAGAQSFFSLQDVRPGLKGTGRTVFSGNRIEEFQVEVLGVLENLTPKQTIILARLSGGPLAETGVLQGMSGSPVYVDGKLLGAVALGFPFSKQPIAGIQPIEQMVAGDRASAAMAESATQPVQIALRHGSTLPDKLSPIRTFTSSFGSLKEIFTPLALSGFSDGTVPAFASEFRRLGLEPQQGVSGGALSSQGSPMHGTVLPGSMISVQLLTGDMTISADGTVTYIDGKRVYAFGHRFLDTGSTDLPFARADVVALLPAVNSSFKLSSAREWVGSMTGDRSTAISGEIGRPAHLIPLSIGVRGANGSSHTYSMQVVSDRLLTTFITQTALFSAVDATERTLGGGTLRLSGRIEFEGSVPPLQVSDIFISDTGVAQQAAADAVATLTFTLGAGFRGLRIKNLRYELEAVESKKQLRIVQAWASRQEVRPGESLDIGVLLQGEDGQEVTRNGTYRVPIGAATGPLNITVSDALTLNSPDFSGLNQASFHSAGTMIAAVNEFRSSDAAYVRIWRQEPVYTPTGSAPGTDLTDPPPSVTLILADPSGSMSGSTASSAIRGATLTELRLPVDHYFVSGAKTIQVGVKD